MSDARFTVSHEYPTADGFPKTLLALAVEHWSDEERDTPFIVLLLQNGAKLDEVDGATELAPFHEIVKKGCPRLVREALKSAVGDTDVNVQDGEGLTPLHHAVEAIKVSCMQCGIFRVIFGKLNIAFAVLFWHLMNNKTE